MLPVNYCQLTKAEQLTQQPVVGIRFSVPTSHMSLWVFLQRWKITRLVGRTALAESDSRESQHVRSI